MNFLKKILLFPRWIALGIIRIYQNTLSFDHGVLRGMYPNGYCKFYPSCSQYGYEAIKKEGIIKGFVRTLWRVIRCNPWSKGGIDKP